MSTFLASLAEAQATASVDVAFPSLDYVRTASGSVAVATLTGAHAVDLAQEDTAPCGDDRTAASTCVTKYAFALVRFEFTVESIRPFGTQHPAAVEVGDQVSFTRGIGVVGTNRPDLDADVERARQAVVAGAPIGTRSVIFMRSSPVSKDATVTEWTLVGADGSLTSTYVPAPDDERPLWTDATRDLEALATLQ